MKRPLRGLLRALLGPFRRRVKGDGVVVICRSDLFPADHGAAVKITRTARALAACGRPVAIVTGRRRQWFEVESDRIHRRRPPAWLQLVAPPWRLVRVVTWLAGYPAADRFLYWPRYDWGQALRAVWAGRRIGARHYLAEFPGPGRAARLARFLNRGTAILAEHNIEYRRLEAQFGPLSRRAARRLCATELRLAASVDAVVCVSGADRDELIAAGIDSRRVHVIPHGVEIIEQPPTRPPRPGPQPEKPVLVYHGPCDYPPNRNAVAVMLDQLLPRLDAAGHACRVLAIGRRADCLPAHPRLTAPGSVDDLPAALAAADVAVVALTSGGGTRMKLLDYFAAGIPVVTTAKGCEGLELEDGREVLIHERPDEMAAAVARLLDDPALRQQLVAAGRTFAEKRSWRRIGQRYDALLAGLDAG